MECIFGQICGRGTWSFILLVGIENLMEIMQKDLDEDVNDVCGDKSDLTVRKG